MPLASACIRIQLSHFLRSPPWLSASLSTPNSPKYIGSGSVKLRVAQLLLASTTASKSVATCSSSVVIPHTGYS